MLLHYCGVNYTISHSLLGLLYHITYRFLVMILHLSLFRIQTFHGAHTDTSFRHAVILRTYF